MARLTTAFATARSNVEPTLLDTENAASAHRDVRACLEADTTLCGLGIDTVLIGSYKRSVAIRRVKDVDVLSKLPELAACDPRSLLALFKAVLESSFGSDRVELQDRSLKVEFPSSDLAVDVVPARPSQSNPGLGYIEIPDRNSGWEETNPEALTDLTVKMNNRYDGGYVPLVKLIRQTRRANLSKRPGGFFFEVLTYNAAAAGLDATSDETLYVSALASVARQLYQAAYLGAPVADPTMPGRHISIRVSDTQMKSASAKFAQLATDAQRALNNAQDCGAALVYQRIMGRNGDDRLVFELPSKCNPDGTEKQLVYPRPGDRSVPAGHGRFA